MKTWRELLGGLIPERDCFSLSPKEMVPLLLAQVAAAVKEDVVLPPVTADELGRFVADTGMDLPEEVAQWLSLCNGAAVGPGGLLGIYTEWTDLDLTRAMERHPAWREKGWLPVGSDGCGNYYLLQTAAGEMEKSPVFFVDHEVDLYAPAYAVASGLWEFVLFVLLYELRPDRGQRFFWPFSLAEVLAIDPELERCAGYIPLPWETN